MLAHDQQSEKGCNRREMKPPNLAVTEIWDPDFCTNIEAEGRLGDTIDAESYGRPTTPI